MFRGTALAHRVSLTGFTWAKHQPSCQCNALSSTESHSVHWETPSSAEQCADRPVTALPQSLPQNIPQACQTYYLWNVSIHFHSCNWNFTLLYKSAQYSDVATSLRGSRSHSISSRPESSIVITIVGRTRSLTSCFTATDLSEAFKSTDSSMTWQGDPSIIQLSHIKGLILDLTSCQNCCMYLL